VVQTAQEVGLVKLGTVAVDGANKVKASASKHKAMSYGRMEAEDRFELVCSWRSRIPKRSPSPRWSDPAPSSPWPLDPQSGAVALIPLQFRAPPRA